MDGDRWEKRESESANEREGERERETDRARASRASTESEEKREKPFLWTIASRGIRSPPSRTARHGSRFFPSALVGKAQLLAGMTIGTVGGGRGGGGGGKGNAPRKGIDISNRTEEARILPRSRRVPSNVADVDGGQKCAGIEHEQGRRWEYR